MSHKQKSTEKVLTNPKRIAGLARRFRDQGEIEMAEMLEVATEVRVRMKGRRVTEVEVPDSVAEKIAYNKKLIADPEIDNKWVITDPEVIADLAQSARKGKDIFIFKSPTGENLSIPLDRIHQSQLAKMLEVAAKVEIWVDEDGGFNVRMDKLQPQ